MWLVGEYSPVALFSLRASTATSSGGRSNLCPTMYAFKMALIAAAFEAGEDGRQVFDLVRDMAIRFRPSRWAVVNGCFVRIQREPHDPGPAPFQPTVAYREYVYFSGPFKVALDVSDREPGETSALTRLLAQVSYIGKRGGFVQFLGSTEATELDSSFSYVLGDQRTSLSSDLIVQFLDDFGPGVTFEAIDTYSDRSARLGRDRVFVSVALPYRLRASSRTYMLYERKAG